MAGKLCSGTPANNAGNKKNSRAFCEGRTYRGQGLSVNFPITDNPHPIESEAGIAWETGWKDSNLQAGSYVDEVGCCCAVGQVLV